jgi:hypothetical protein
MQNCIQTISTGPPTLFACQHLGDRLPGSTLGEPPKVLPQEEVDHGLVFFDRLRRDSSARLTINFLPPLDQGLTPSQIR